MEVITVTCDISKLSPDPVTAAVVFANCNVRVWTKDGEIAGGSAIDGSSIDKHSDVAGDKDPIR